MDNTSKIVAALLAAGLLIALAIFLPQMIGPKESTNSTRTIVYNNTIYTNVPTTEQTTTATAANNEAQIILSSPMELQKWREEKGFLEQIQLGIRIYYLVGKPSDIKGLIGWTDLEKVTNTLIEYSITHSDSNLGNGFVDGNLDLVLQNALVYEDKDGNRLVPANEGSDIKFWQIDWNPRDFLRESSGKHWSDIVTTASQTTIPATVPAKIPASTAPKDVGSINVPTTEKTTAAVTAKGRQATNPAPTQTTATAANDRWKELGTTNFQAKNTTNRWASI
jgi:hypothetical protein